MGGAGLRVTKMKTVPLANRGRPRGSVALKKASIIGCRGVIKQIFRWKN
jgi:hypothetical protein